MKRPGGSVPCGDGRSTSTHLFSRHWSSLSKPTPPEVLPGERPAAPAAAWKTWEQSAQRPRPCQSQRPFHRHTGQLPSLEAPHSQAQALFFGSPPWDCHGMDGKTGPPAFPCPTTPSHLHPTCSPRWVTRKQECSTHLTSSRQGPAAQQQRATPPGRRTCSNPKATFPTFPSLHPHRTLP